MTDPARSGLRALPYSLRLWAGLARGHFVRRSSATGTVARRVRLARGHLGRSALKVDGERVKGFFRPGRYRAVAAPVRARMAGF